MNIKLEIVIFYVFLFFCDYRLYIVKGKSVDVFLKLFKNWGVSYLIFEEDIEFYVLTRDFEIKKLVDEYNVKVIFCVFYILFDL